MLHFINFRDPQRYENALRVFGPPDFIHRIWDIRAREEIAKGDVAIFAKGEISDQPSPYSWDDSSQPDDPAAKERREK